MAGHSKWANIKHRKARQDAARGKVWSRCSKAIIVAAKAGGGDPSMNLTLRYAIEDARAENMPKDNITRAIKRGTGESGENVEYTAVRYEGYGANGVAFVVDTLTENVNRTAPQIRSIFDKAGGNMGKPGSVSFGFDEVSLVIVPAEGLDEEKAMEIALEAGAEDVQTPEGAFEITGPPAACYAIRDAFVDAGVEPSSFERTMIPQNEVACDLDTAKKVLRLFDALDEHDDVQKVYHNGDLPPEAFEA
jgi:YebC/PmpR family DNA-binding regulatory protein